MSCLRRSHLSGTLILGCIVTDVVLSDCYFRHANSMESYEAKTIFSVLQLELAVHACRVRPFSIALIGIQKKKRGGWVTPIFPRGPTLSTLARK
jgi:hypothetical protein